MSIKRSISRNSCNVHFFYSGNQQTSSSCAVIPLPPIQHDSINSLRAQGHGIPILAVSLLSTPGRIALYNLKK